jgi:predicted ribosome quality control (RQC) complex YloA/Tae2 family protein
VFDSLAIAAIADELRDFVGGRVQRAVQVDRLSIGLELYARGERRWLYATADPERSGLWLVEDGLGQAPGVVSPLLLLLRKWARGARLLAVEQPPFERVLHLAFESSPYVEQEAESAPARRLDLIVEATGRLANLILVDEAGRVMDAIKRVPPTINRVRTILPRRPYVPPPPQEKATPYHADAGLLREGLRGRDGTAASALTALVRGISPLAAREAVFRAGAAADAGARDVDPERVAAALTELVAPLRDPSAWRPSLARPGEAYSAFAPYELTHAGAFEPAGTFSAAVQRFFGNRAAGSTRDQARTQLKRELVMVLERERRRLESLERELAGSGQADGLRHAGELLLAYATSVPSGADRVDLHGQAIALDPRRGAVENAQAYFERYGKARDAARRLPELITQARARVDYLAEALVHADLADDPEAVAALRRELAAGDALGGSAPPAGRKPARGGAPSPLRLRLGEHTVLVGRSGNQNDEVTFRLASPEDLWLHARGVPGAHVVLRVGVHPPGEATVRQAAEIAAYHSASRAASSVPVDVTERRHVRKIKGGPPGAVTYSRERTLSVAPRAPTRA